jgi:hypothetical protein
MDASAWLILWGSPVGIAVFFAGLGVLLWGLGKLKHAQVAQAELELKERQRYYERAQARESADPSAR